MLTDPVLVAMGERASDRLIFSSEKNSLSSLYLWPLLWSSLATTHATLGWTSPTLPGDNLALTYLANADMLVKGGL